MRSFFSFVEAGVSRPSQKAWDDFGKFVASEGR
jgi:hypothetical protein